MTDLEKAAPPLPPAAPTPAEALADLLAGNHRFVTNTRLHPHQDAEHRAALATAQRPFAVLFGCSDSRLAAEIIFDRGLGDLFVVRTAGHIVGPEVLASIEFGVAVLGAPLVVVLGHEDCGAVKAAESALGGAHAPDNLRPIVDGVLPSVRAAHADGVTDYIGMADIHVRHTAAAVAKAGSVVDAVAAGRCAVVGMSYWLAEGRVSVVAPL
ncbi:carbonic anhydrase [Pilimelia columellifera]|uniref:carbonic anhydrase n=1 Tax=Pilimelia columellifera subsp. columellifera TaxID=706583 RepID=A0ABN3MW44_9ACTN